MQRRSILAIGGLSILGGCLSTTDDAEPENNDNEPEEVSDEDNIESDDTDDGSREESADSEDTEADGTESTDDGETDPDDSDDQEPESEDSSDNDPPKINDFSFSGEEFEPGDIIEIDVEATTGSDIERLYFRFEHTEGGGAVFDAYRDFSQPVESGTYTISYQWPEDTPGGTYEATWIIARDSLGNRENWRNDFAVEKRQLEIISDSSDTDGPQIHDFAFSDQEFEPGDVIEIDVEVTDETDIERLYFRFEHIDGGGAVFDAYRDFSPPVESGTYTISYQWPEDIAGGTYEATWIFAKDSIGNSQSWQNEFAATEKQVEINSDIEDTDGPTIHDFSFSNREFEPGEIMEIDVEVTDETDIERLYFRFEHTDGGGAVFDAYRDFSPPVDDGTYTISYQWPDDTPGGTYEATWIFAKDSIGNSQSWQSSFPIGEKQLEVVE